MGKEELVINREELYERIFEVVQDIENELYDLNKSGVFFAPELHIVFEIGKALFRNRKALFGDEKINWLRERNFGNGGPSDLAFELNPKSEYVVFEFKVADKWSSYLGDIQKLQRLKNDENITYHRFFVALVDSFLGKVDPRILEVQNPFGLKPEFKRSFPVSYSGYKSSMDCTLVIYEVK
ncbi:hypothetical protein SAMN04488519_10912 [Algoriphagus ornithinivorans]|uniref:PD-(D/E)XK nuclease superfamily protein n=1 Tax=Algoriphagus ornithinivorans TaxID=226506 RepID=A0A1I5IIE3_9BACT|nr:hypothetical protein [Algoriphagus ornithinivorans]SFO60335.1 hypothetical protein SAMN04488519_10912 [Algoriphagus ornithinivorans]